MIVHNATYSPGLSDSPAFVTALAIIAGVCLALSTLLGLVALALSGAERRRLTLRGLLALAWLATLLIPALTLGAAALLGSLLQSLPASAPYHLDGAQATAFAILAPIAAFLLTMASVAWLMGRIVLRPLAAMGEAARQIAGGDLEIALPGAPLHEVAEVTEAFGAMGTALRDSLERQAEVEQERGLFVSAIAHDLRTPLFSLRGYLEGLDKGLADTPEKAARYLAVCRRQVEALDGLVADLFTYTRLEHLEQRPAREPLELGELLRAVIENARPRAEEKGVALLEDGPACGCPLEGDARQLTRAFANVLDNALRYTPPGGRVCAQWRREARRAIVCVYDSGPGFAPDDLPRLFTPLYRGDASRNRSTGGAGLGLAIARRILLAHDGDLRAANREEGGAEVTATLPASEA